MADNGMTMIEVNGMKLEVDLRYARRVDTLKVGDRVKVLTKDYSGHSVHPGTIIGFEPFTALPTIIVAYIKQEYSKSEVKFLHFNSASKDIELVKAVDDDGLDIKKEIVLKQLDNEIATKQREIDEINMKREYFLRNFNAYWAPIPKPESAVPV